LSTTRFCVKCGREVAPEELVNGLCIDCYLRYHGVFKEKPRVELVTCPKCGSWYFKGVWHPYLDTREVIRRELLEEARRFLHSGIEVIDVEVVTDIYKINASQHGVRAVFTLEVNKKHIVKVEETVVVESTRRVCDKCLRRTTGSHKALVQVRFDLPGDTGDIYSELGSLLYTLGLEDSIVEVVDGREGFDVKFEDIMSARKYAGAIARKYGAKVAESFKSTKYDYQSGKWSGVLTISVRVPVLRVNDIVRYKGRIGIVRSVKEGSLRVFLIESGEEVEVDMADYWSSLLVKPSDIYIDKKVYTVTAVSKTMLYLLHEDSGELKEIQLTPGSYGLKPGDKVIILSDGEKELVLKIGQGGAPE